MNIFTPICVNRRDDEWWKSRNRLWMHHSEIIQTCNFLRELIKRSLLSLRIWIKVKPQNVREKRFAAEKSFIWSLLVFGLKFHGSSVWRAARVHAFIYVRSSHPPCIISMKSRRSSIISVGFPSIPILFRQSTSLKLWTLHNTNH